MSQYPVLHTNQLFSHGTPTSSTDSVSSSTNSTSPGSRTRSFPCPEAGCDRWFHRKFTLREHLKTHTGEKLYECSIVSCGKRFSTSGNLARHLRLHSMKTHVCPADDCERVFTKAEKLAWHVRVHMGNAAYECSIPGCNKTFSTSGNLTRHIRTQHRLCKSTSKASDAAAALRSPPAPVPAVLQELKLSSCESSRVALQYYAANARSHVWTPTAQSQSRDSLDGISDHEISDLLQCLFVDAPTTMQPHGNQIITGEGANSAVQSQ